LRLKAGFVDESAPNNFSNGWCGELYIGLDDQEMLLYQPHPIKYWKQKKVTGTKNTYTAIEVSEVLTLPLTIALCYKSDLTDVDVDPIARMYADVISEYQGREIHTELEIPLELAHDWQRATATLTNVRGYVRSYGVYLQLKNVAGTVRIDNIVISHGGTNWARDKNCTKINTVFTRQFANVPKHWAPVIIGEASDYYSLYKDTVTY
jgi:hypothetical protein